MNAVNEDNFPNSHEFLALAERSKLFDQVLSSITDFVYTFDLEGRFTFVNKPLLDLWGQSLAEAVGKNFFELPYPPDLAAKLQSQIQEVITTGKTLSDETPYENPTGSLGFYQYIFSPVLDDSGKVIAVAGTTRDISERRRLELERERSAATLGVERANLAAVVEKAPSFICLLRGPNHIFEVANQRYYEIVGGRNLVGLSVKEALPEIADKGFVELLDKVYQSGEPFVGNEIDVMLGPDGELNRRILNFVYQAIHGVEGNIEGVFVHGVDVTELVLAREELQSSQENAERQQRLYEAILSNTPDFAYILTLDHHIAYANENLLEMWGQTKESAVGKTWLELGYEPWHADMHNREIDQVVETKAPIRGEVPFTGTFGRRIYDYIFVPVFDGEGNVEAVAGTTRDITDRVELESKLSEQTELLQNEARQKDEFLAMLSHELRNPLAPISTAVDLLKISRSENEDPLHLEARTIIERQVTSLTKIVNDLLEVSRVVSGRIHLDLKVIDLNQVVKHAVETTKPLVEQYGHQLTVSLCPTPLLANIDATRVEEVFVNLLNNAAKYTHDGGKIEVFCESGPDSETVKVRVRDNGVGVEEKLMPHIFDLFTQADRSLDRAAGGLGIGLSLASRLVALHSGSITVHSPPEGKSEGSEFIVTLPLGSVAKPEETTETPGPTDAEANGLRVLVVDDNRDLVHMLSIFLRHSGYVVQTAHDGKDAVQAAIDWVPDVIVLDIGLPGLNGYEVVKVLRDNDQIRDKRIIAITGYGTDADVARALEAGFDAHLTKPYALDDLERVIHGSQSG